MVAYECKYIFFLVYKIIVKINCLSSIWISKYLTYDKYFIRSIYSFQHIINNTMEFMRETLNNALEKTDNLFKQRVMAIYDSIIEISKLSTVSYTNMTESAKQTGKQTMLKLINAILGTSLSEYELEQTFDGKNPNSGSWKLLIAKILMNFMAIVFKIFSIISDKRDTITRTFDQWSQKYKDTLAKLGIKQTGGILCAGLCIAALAILIIVIVCVIGIVLVYAISVIGVVSVKLLDTIFACWNTYQNASKHKLALSKMDSLMLTKQGIELAKQDVSSDELFTLIKAGSEQSTSGIVSTGHASISGITSVGVAGVSSVTSNAIPDISSIGTSIGTNIGKNIIQTGGGLSILSSRLTPNQLFEFIKKFMIISDLYKDVSGIVYENMVKFDKENIRAAIDELYKPNGSSIIIENAKKNGDIHGGLLPLLSIIQMYPIMVDYAKLCKNKGYMCDIDKSMDIIMKKYTT